MRIAILVSTPVRESLRDDVRAGMVPLPDYFALAEALDATLIAPAEVSSGRNSRVSKLRSMLGPAWAAFRRRNQYDLIISDVDRVGLILALLFKLAGIKKRHILITHGKLSSRWDSRFFKMFRLDKHIDRFVCYGPTVAQRLTRALGIPERKVNTVRHAADHRFWRPVPGTPERLVSAAGLFHRDYNTLVKAVRDLDVSLVIAAHSPWVTGQKRSSVALSQPENVQFVRLSYHELRALYARSLVVALPLLGSRGPAGSLVLYEAMAMGKVVVATRTEGQEGLDVLQEGETGFYIAPQDVDGWRNAITYLCDHPKEAIQMGQRARALVEERWNLDTYTRDMVDIISSVTAEGRDLSVNQESPVER